jgi:electron transport complex, RnfABCDGE type, C subunit
MGWRVWERRKGVAMAHDKETAGDPVRPLDPPPLLRFPVQQHQGKPAVPVVKRGDEVRIGTLLARADGPISAPVHSSVSGKVKAIEPVLHPWGIWSMAIIVENDGEDRWEELPPGIKDPESVSPEVIRQRVQEAGIVGMGGAMFPAAVKLAPSTPIDTVVINGCECEPVLTCDHRTMLERTDALLYGMRAIRHAVGAKRVILAIEANKGDAIRLYRELANVYRDFEVRALPARYPYGGERVLVPAVTGRKIPPGRYPDSVGVVVHNVATVAAIADALRDGIPLIRRPVTVAGAAVAKPCNLMIPIGTPLEDVLKAVGLRERPREIVMGGPMMGITVASDDVPVIKGTSGVLARTEAELHHFRESACLRCGRCVDACPAGLMPTMLARLSSRGLFDKADELGATECMECGLCSYVCPADLPLTQLIRMGKREIIKKARAGRGA